MKKQKTITNLMTIIFAFTLLLQVLILLSVLYIGRVPEKIKDEAYLNFNHNIENNILRINNVFEKKVNIKSILRNIETEIDNHFGNINNLLTSTKEEQLTFLESTPDYLLAIISSTNSDGAFIILENNYNIISNEVEKEGLYISVNRNSTMFTERFTANIVDESININSDYITKDPEFNLFKFDLNNENDKYYNELIKAPNSIAATNYYPFINMRYQDFLNEDVINITFPLYDQEAKSVVYIGLEFKTSKLLNLIYIEEEISYLLATSNRNYSSINPLFSWGEIDNITNDSTIYVEKLQGRDSFYMINNQPSTTLGIKTLRIYPDMINPYNDEFLVLVGFINNSKLSIGSIYVENVILALILVSVVLGFIMIWLVNDKIANPIRQLAKLLDARSTNKFTDYEKTNIEEINNLILAFEKLSHDVTDYSNKLSNALELSLLGLYYHQEQGDVYCTQAFLDICDSDLLEGYIPRNKFDVLYKQIVNSYYDSNYEAYQLKSKRWVKLEENKERAFTIGLLTDVTKKINDIMKIEEKLDYDNFTNLYNQIAFMNLANKVLMESKGQYIAVIMWDMDKLKYINDRFGHDAGDRYIIKFANTIKTLEKDGAIVARRSGDEFLAIIAKDDKTEIEHLIGRITSLINKSELVIKTGIVEKLRASIGVAWYPEDGKDLKSLLNFADKMVYQSKYEYGSIHNIINQETKANVNLFHFNNELIKVISGDYITFAYQPIVDVKSGEVFGYELLMRIFSDILNNSKKLIDIARENDSLERVEGLTFSKGFESYQMHIDDLVNKKIFVNSITDAKLADKVVKELLELTNNNLEMLIVELTDFLNSNKDKIVSKINLFKQYKAEIAIDNFKLEFINEIDTSYKIDYLKIDISIINNISTYPEQQDILDEIIKFAKSNNYKIIAVGIKNLEELKFVINRGVDYVQGFYIADPTVKPADINSDVKNIIKELFNKFKNRDS